MKRIFKIYNHEFLLETGIEKKQSEKNFVLFAGSPLVEVAIYGDYETAEKSFNEIKKNLVSCHLNLITPNKKWNLATYTGEL